MDVNSIERVQDIPSNVLICSRSVKATRIPGPASGGELCCELFGWNDQVFEVDNVRDHRADG